MFMEPGMLARSKAGRDKDCIYVIISVNDEYVYLADGRNALYSNLKKKNRRHVQIIYKMQCEDCTDDAAIQETIQKLYTKKHTDADVYIM